MYRYTKNEITISLSCDMGCSYKFVTPLSFHSAWFPKDKKKEEKKKKRYIWILGAFNNTLLTDRDQ